VPAGFRLGGSIHRGPALFELLAHHFRIYIEHLRAHASELNPAEQAWNHCKTELANDGPLSVAEFMDELSRVA
jgi:hypothetical protein